MNYGVSLDVVGNGFNDLSEEHREEILGQFPRTDFKKKIIPTFFEGFKHKTGTTYGTIKKVDGFQLGTLLPNGFASFMKFKISVLV